MAARVPPEHVEEETVRKALDDLAFDLKINGLRLMVHHLQNVEAQNDNDDPFHIRLAGYGFSRPFPSSSGTNTIDPMRMLGDIVVPLKQRVESTGTSFSTYVSPIYKYERFPAHWHDPEEYAEFAEAYVGWLKDTFGFYPTYWVIVNEPREGFFQTGELVRDIVAVGKRFQARGFPTKIQAPETLRPDPAALRQVVNNPDAVSFLGLLSFHGYDYQSGKLSSFSSRNAIRRIGRRLGIRTAMTEVCCKRGWKGGYDQALGVARDIYWNLTEADISIWEPLGMFNPNQISWDRDGKGYHHKPPYYAMRQFSRYIRPGYVRVEVECSGCPRNDEVQQVVKPVAFRSPDGKLVLVVVNDQAGAQELELNLPPGSYEITGVDPKKTEGQTYAALEVAPDQVAKFALPAQAIVTFAQK